MIESKLLNSALYTNEKSNSFCELEIFKNLGDMHKSTKIKEEYTVHNNKKTESSNNWIYLLKDMLDNFDNDSQLYQEHLRDKRLSKHPFKEITYPFLNYFISVDNCYNKLFENRVLLDCLTQIITTIVFKNITKSLVLQINLLREDNMLNGKSSRERYDYYCRMLKDKQYFIHLIKEHPFAFRDTFEEINNQLGYLYNVINNLERDFSVLKKEFNIDGKLININLGAGDSHRLKKTVVLLTFEKGKIVYKPRNMKIDLTFNMFINLINTLHKNFDLKALKVINNVDYGWQEFVESKLNLTLDEAQDLYYRIGIYSCIFYSLNATDLHYENMIIKKEIPVFIDLETLFQNYEYTSFNDNSFVRELESIKKSVLRTNLFPATINKHESIDVSGIRGGRSGMEIPSAKYAFENLYQDNIKIIKKSITTTGSDNIPSINNEKIDPRDFKEHILKGFEECYDTFLKNRNVILNSDIWKDFEISPVRVIPRNTHVYNSIINVLSNPNYNMNYRERENLFNVLQKGLEDNSRLYRLIKYEIFDLKNLDVPYFYSYPGKKSIFSSDDIELENYHLESSINEVRDKISNLSIFDKHSQLKKINQSMIKPIKRWDLKSEKVNYLENNILKKQIPMGNLAFIDEAENIANYIMRNNLSTLDEQVMWENINISSYEKWVISPQDDTLYDGLLGNCIFFASLYSVTKNVKYFEFTEKILSSINEIEKYKNSNNLSTFEGDIGKAYAYYYLGLLFNNKKYKNMSKKILLKSKDLINSDNQYDLINGASGYLMVASRIYKYEKDDDLYTILNMLGEHLINGVKEYGYSNIGWKNSVSQDSILAGMSHGNSGIALSLLELYKVTKDSRYYEVARKAILSENKLFSTEDNNWSDNRSRDNRKKMNFPDPVNWCHGASGIGLSRVYMKSILGENFEWDKDIENAIRKILSEGFGGSDCLCHGSMGNLEFFISYYQTNPNKLKYLTMARKIGHHIISQAKNKQWYCGIPQKTPVFGLMTGMSGIGYQLLRLAYPNKIPSILTLELPGASYGED